MKTLKRIQYVKEYNARPELKKHKLEYSRKPEVIAMRKQWALDNPGNVSVTKYNDRLKRSGRGDEIIKWSDFSKEEQEQINAIYKHRDELNQLSGKWEVDHIQSVADGGKHEASNLQVITAKENHKKQ